MADRWFYRTNGKADGPYNTVQIRQLVSSGVITAETPLRQGDEGSWLRADRVQGLIKGPAAAPARTKTTPVAAAVSTAKVATVKAKPAVPPPAAMSKPAPVKVRAVDAAVPVARAAVVAPALPAQTSAADVRHRRRQNPLPLIVAVVVIGVLILGGGAATIIAFVVSPSATDVDDAQSAPSTTVAANSEVAAETLDKGGDTGAALRQPASTRKAAVAAVKSWKPAISEQGAKAGVKSSKMQVKFDMAWLGGDANRDVGGPELVEAKRRPKYLFVRLLISNMQAEQPLEYRGWNTIGHETEAILIDEAGEFAELVPLADASADRLSDVSISPKGKATDVLVFAIADPDFERLRLALPFPGMGHCGFQIDRAMLAEPGQPAETSEIAKQPDDQDPVLGDIPADEPPVVDDAPQSPPSTPEATAEAEPTDDPPADLDELQRSIAEQAGGEEQPPAAAGDKPKP